MAFMFIVTGALTAPTGVVGYLMPRVRNLETELPDHVSEDTAG